MIRKVILEEGNDFQEKTKNDVEQSVSNIDLNELKKEIIVLKELIQQAEHIKLYECGKEVSRT